MANTFKLHTKDGSSTNANTAMTIYTVPSSTTSVVLGLTLSNLVGTTVYVTVQIENADGDNVNFLKNIPIPTGSAVEVMAGNKIVLNTTDVLKVTSDAANSIDTTLSVMEIS
jgi:hypothetical protein